MLLTVIIPTFNEAPNVPELVRRLAVVLDPDDAEILFVDDSTDDTPAAVLSAAEWSAVPTRLLHRDQPVGGLSGAVIEGLRESTSEWCLVMDGDLQHPPEMIPALLATARETQADVAVASRYCGGGDNTGLSGWARRSVSSMSTSLTRAMFPRRLRHCTDPMTGFFAVRRAAVDLERLRPRGFKILLEILARHRLTIVEEPFIFAQRFAGQSKANLAQGMRFLSQLAALRFGRMSRFAIIGAFGALANLAIMAGLTVAGMHYAVAAAVAAAATIVGNFFLQEQFVFRDLRTESRLFWDRFGSSLAFNGTEALIRLPLLVIMVEQLFIPSLVAQGTTIAVAFFARFVFHAQVVYRPRGSGAVSARLRRLAADRVWPTANEERT
ncbi:glycosyltransferase family 2 protein [Cryobacterium cheniae]|uniref:Glycosyltransferase family 2 protein n=1 Tax=Cryobacterium cheniae TaxID=1259262 RepID=A0A4R8XQB6_9MICO|nr:glycosyltransferase family 2 protein [Cryobacterium cheniae]TFC81235.1 glycosyltransferase family 2 protein [Cryobacterium cheniae]